MRQKARRYLPPIWLSKPSDLSPRNCPLAASKRMAAPLA